MPEGQDSGQEKTEEATPRRLQQSREEGQVARSRELNTTLLLLASSFGLIAMGPALVGDLLAIMRRGFLAQARDFQGGREIVAFLVNAMMDAVFALTPFMLLALMVALLAPTALGGWVFSTKSLAVKWEKLDPIKGIKRVISWSGLMELFKALAKFLLILGVAILLLWNRTEEALGLATEPLGLALIHVGSYLSWSFALLCTAMIVIALADVPFQLWDHGKKQRMSRQEVKEEFKETEGKPEVKTKIRSLQQELAQRRMMEQVPKADVVITNPEHYAVALRYDVDHAQAPRVVAKGADLVAQRIREAARAHKVVLVEAPPLARALYFSTALEQEIPGGLYLAVANVLAYVFRLREMNAGPVKAPSFRDLPIPEELRKD